MNIIIDVTYLISGIYTNLCSLLCRKILRYLPRCNEIDDYWLAL